MQSFGILFVGKDPNLVLDVLKTSRSVKRARHQSDELINPVQMSPSCPD